MGQQQADHNLVKIGNVISPIWRNFAGRDRDSFLRMDRDGKLIQIQGQPNEPLISPHSLALLPAEKPDVSSRVGQLQLATDICGA
jgi:hypothetical protein